MKDEICMRIMLQFCHVIVERIMHFVWRKKSSSVRIWFVYQLKIKLKYWNVLFHTTPYLPLKLIRNPDHPSSHGHDAVLLLLVIQLCYKHLKVKVLGDVASRTQLRKNSFLVILSLGHQVTKWCCSKNMQKAEPKRPTVMLLCELNKRTKWFWVTHLTAPWGRVHKNLSCTSTLISEHAHHVSNW